MKAIVLISVAICTSCTSIINSMAFHPDTNYILEKNELPMNCKLLSIITDDQIRLDALYFETSNAQKKQKIIVYFHGNGANIYSHIPSAEKLAEIGSNVLLVSYRGYAKSQGKPSEKGVYKDGMAAIKYATNELGFRLENVSIYGFSIGTAVAIHTAQYLNIEKLILIAPLSNGKEYAESVGLKWFKWIVGNSFNSTEKINNVKCPILIIHGTEDRVIAYRLGEKLFNTYNGIKEMVSIRNGGHNNLEEMDYSKYWNTIEGFLNKKPG